MANWVSDLSKSNHAFLTTVWPCISTKCGGGEIKPVEVLSDNKLAKDLDVLCGIDIWQTVGGEGCRGIASRVQFGDKDWGTFTVRSRRFSGAKTEYQKRLHAIQSGGRFIYPYITCHAYVTNFGELLNAYVATTKSIFEAIESGNYEVRQTTNAEFFAVDATCVESCWSFK